MGELRFWWWHALVPFALLGLMAALLASPQMDHALARQVFFDASTGQWLGGGTWWAERLLHDGGRWLIRLIGAALVVATVVAARSRRYRHWMRPLLFVVLAMALSTAAAGTLKSLTNVDCPWDLQEFGGSRPYVALLADRPDNLPAARCFPAAHASSGFALLAFYFVWRDRHRGLARLALAIGAAVGVAFAFAQQARGAHFPSHDVASLALVWSISLALYAGAFRRRLWYPQTKTGAVPMTAPVGSVPA